jgi:hypothetical protein
MNRFSEELRIIPRLVWPIALVAGIGSAWLTFLLLPRDPNMSKWPITGKIAFAIWPAIFLFATVLLVGYVNADARRRGMRYIMWTLLAIFIPNAIGFILYFVLREPLLIPCPQCGSPGRTGFVFCPRCGAEISLACPACKRSIEPAWNRCAYCGTGLNPKTS